MPLAPGTKLGPYEILAPIGAGGMGEVYKARDPRLGRDVAVKVSAERFSDRFEREARAVAALNHPHICQLYDVGPDYLVMELVDGKPLASPLPLSEALPIAMQIADALDHAHRRGVVHRDLKPSNILMTKAGIKLLDFGLAKMGATAPLTEQNETATMGMIMGTPAYMSPEQWEGKPADARSDIFSFGAVLYELLTGKQAFAGATAASILASVMRDHPTGTAELTGPVEPVLRRCLAKDPDQRFQTAADLKWALENLTTPKPAAAVSASPSGPSKAAIAERFFLTLFFLLTAALGIAWFTQKPTEIPSLRFYIDPPRGASFTNPYHATEISPDGKLLVFAAAPAGGNVTLWLRPLDSLEARELPGTVDGNGPFWSPDGKSIGFFSGGKLKRIDAAGGSPQVLCDAPEEQGGTWNKDGVILFAAGGVIQRVAAGGGAAAPLTALDPARQEATHDFPQFLPDGHTFLYFIESANPDVQGIYAATLEQPRPDRTKSDQTRSGARIIPTITKAQYAPPFAGKPGELLWLRDQNLVAQRFDTDTLRLEGDPVPVADGISMGAIPTRAAFWVSANGILAYRSGGGAVLQMTWIGRDGKQINTLADVSTDVQPRVSPDGGRVAVARNVSGNIDIWLYELAGRMTRLTFDTATENNPVWSPDGRQVAFASNRSGVYQLYRKDAGGAGPEERLHEGPYPEIPLDWSRDGKYLLYTEQNPKSRADLMILPLEGERKPIVFAQTPYSERNGGFSPDGKWIAYSSDDTGRTEVYIRASPTVGGASGAAAGGRWQVSNNGAISPRWNGDGKELFYHTTPGMDAAGIRIVAGRPEIDTPHRLFDILGLNSYDVSADGKRFLMLVYPGGATAGTLAVVSNWQMALKK
jgi:serine/threonine protein kinase